VLICDRDRKWSGEVGRQLQAAGVRVVLTAERAPNDAERFVRSIKQSCLSPLIPLGARHFSLPEPPAPTGQWRSMWSTISASGITMNSRTSRLWGWRDRCRGGGCDDSRAWVAAHFLRASRPTAGSTEHCNIMPADIWNRLIKRGY